MKAVRLYEGPEVRVEEVPEPEVGPGQIRVAVQAAGVCGTDLHAARGTLPMPMLPVIMGHEGAGIVDGVGEGVTEFKAGDRVLLLPSETCGACPAWPWHDTSAEPASCRGSPPPALTCRCS